jgi:hypothetical protein
VKAGCSLNRTYTDHRKSHFPHFLRPKKSKKPTALSHCGPFFEASELRLDLRRNERVAQTEAQVSHCAALSRVASVALADRCAIVVATMPRM